MPSYRDKVIADGALAYWRLGEASGTSAFSEVGGYTGTISGGVTLNQPGPLAEGNAAMRFNGTTGRIDAGNIAAFNFGAGAFTIEAWITLTAGGASQVIVGKGQNSSTGWRAFVHGTNKLVLFWGSDAQFYPVAARVITVGDWHHAIWGYDAGAGKVFYALDGVYESSVQTNHAVTSTDPVTIARDATTFFASATIDEVAIYPTALTTQQIADHYAARLLPAAGMEPYAPIVLPSAKPPHGQWTPLTPSDIVDSPFSALWVGGAGTVAAVGLDGRVVPFTGVQAGTRLRIAGRRVNDTATTATNLLALGRV